MNLIIGGYSQGKLDFALTLLEDNSKRPQTGALAQSELPDCTLPDSNMPNNIVADGEVIALEDAFDLPVLNKLHLLIKRLVVQDIDAYSFVEQGLTKNPDITLICDEMSTGVIPIAKEDRMLQETVGRIQCLIAKRAEKVYRVYCSIPTLIKG